jgi:hypothetical protein
MASQFKSKLAKVAVINVLASGIFCALLSVAHLVLACKIPAMINFPTPAIIGAIMGQGAGVTTVAMIRAAFENIKGAK